MCSYIGGGGDAGVEGVYSCKDRFVYVCAFMHYAFGCVCVCVFVFLQMSHLYFRLLIAFIVFLFCLIEFYSSCRDLFVFDSACMLIYVSSCWLQILFVIHSFGVYIDLCV